jgi:hypothetical protein
MEKGIGNQLLNVACMGSGGLQVKVSPCQTLTLSQPRTLGMKTACIWQGYLVAGQKKQFRLRTHAEPCTPRPGPGPCTPRPGPGPCTPRPGPGPCTPRPGPGPGPGAGPGRPRTSRYVMNLGAQEPAAHELLERKDLRQPKEALQEAVGAGAVRLGGGKGVERRVPGKECECVS